MIYIKKKYYNKYIATIHQNCNLCEVVGFIETLPFYRILGPTLSKTQPVRLIQFIFIPYQSHLREISLF